MYEGDAVVGQEALVPGRKSRRTFFWVALYELGSTRKKQNWELISNSRIIDAAIWSNGMVWYKSFPKMFAFHVIIQYAFFH